MVVLFQDFESFRSHWPSNGMETANGPESRRDLPGIFDYSSGAIQSCEQKWSRTFVRSGELMVAATKKP